MNLTTTTRRNDGTRNLSLFSPFDRFFDTFARGLDLTGAGTQAGSFRVDLSETDTEYRIEAELPGVAEKDIDVSLEDGVITVSAERRAEHAEETEGRRYVERSYGSFQRSFRLPAEVDADKIAASLKRGILTVSVPKAEAAKPRRIEVASQGE